jgi:hypothetical protein
MEILYIIILVLLISNIFFIWRGTKLVKEVEDRATDYINLMDDTNMVLNRMLNDMRELDIKGSFESDDEVGTVFTELKNTIEKYKELYNA